VCLTDNGREGKKNDDRYYIRVAIHVSYNKTQKIYLCQSILIFFPVLLHSKEKKTNDKQRGKTTTKNQCCNSSCWFQ
jgi:hypothetical protein